MPNPREMFFADPEDFFNRYSINLPGNPQEAGKIGQIELMQSTFKPVVRDKTVSGSGVTDSSASKSFFKFNKSSDSVRVSALAHNAAWKVDDGQKKATLIVRKAPGTQTLRDTSDLKWFLCLMLPWVDNGITTMKLRKHSRADAFFTGQMNGCSFAVSGDPTEPFVTHINCHNADDYEGKFQDTLSKSGGKTDNAKRLGREAYKLDAHGTKLVEDQVVDQLSQGKRKLASSIITDTLCFVMGRRVEGRWEFFYQRVITQQYSHKQRLGKAGGLIKFLGLDHRTTEQTVVYRALTPYTKLWPEGSGRLVL
jgi:hypothetical protein